MTRGGKECVEPSGVIKQAQCLWGSGRAGREGNRWVGGCAAASLWSVIRANDHGGAAGVVILKWVPM